MPLVKINYYDGYDIDSMELYEVEEQVISELNKFIDLGVCEDTVYKVLSGYISSSESISQEDACCYFIENNGKKIEFSAENRFQTNLK
jgi:hypothetical protein